MSTLLTSAQIASAFQAGTLPAWVGAAYAEFRTKVEDETFPCTFGIVAHRKGDLLYAFVDSPDLDQVLAHLHGSLVEFTAYARQLTPVNAAMQALTVLIKPDGQEHSLPDYFDQSWAMLQWLHEHDLEAWPERVPLDPDDPAWSFCFGGLPLFINFHTPAHQRRSRAMKSAFTLLIQPRDGFDVIAGDHEKGRHARQIIRDRLGVYDGHPPHPALGHYGSGLNREWQQYFLPDGDDLLAVACPFK